MKKLPTILLSTLTLGLANLGLTTHPASALYIDDDGATWYKVSEMLEYKNEFDQLAEDQCGDNTTCLQDLYFAKMESEDPKFWALEQLVQQQITVTSVNPGEGTLKVLFFDEDTMMKRMGIHEHLTLGEFYMGWFEYDVNRIYNYGSYVDKLSSDTFPGAHLIYFQSDNSEGNIPANQEFELSVPEANLSLNTSGEIGYGAFADPYFNAAGRFIYTSCLSEPDYFEGAECRMMISPEKGIAYFPPRETIFTLPSQEDDNSNASDSGNSDLGGDNPDNLATDSSDKPAQSTPEPGATTAVAVANEPDITSEAVTIASSAPLAFTASSISTTTPKTPNTGAESTLYDQGSASNFPWWLGAIFASGIVTLAWLFIPSRSRK